MKLTDEERDNIIERITFEETARRDIVSKLPSGQKRETWWNRLNSNIMVLLVGAIITGFLVPIFQHNQKTLEWKRQLKFDDVSFKTQMMRDCFQEFILASAFTSEAIERVLPFVQKKEITEKEYNQFTADFINMQNSRFKQFSKVASYVMYFENADSIQGLVNGYVRTSTDYIRKTEEYVRLKFCKSVPQECEGVENNENTAMDISRLEDYLRDLGNVQRAFHEVTNGIKKEIETFQQENADYTF